MVLMLDGTMLRSRGQDWGMKLASAPGDRVAWHELKASLVTRLPESSSDGKRWELAKFYVVFASDPESRKWLPAFARPTASRTFDYNARAGRTACQLRQEDETSR